MLVPCEDIDSLLAQARTSGKQSNCNAPSGHVGRACSSLACSKMHHRAMQVLHLDLGKLVHHVEISLHTLKGSGELHITDNPRDAAKLLVEKCKQMLCRSTCQCMCHACDQTCSTHGALLKSVKSGEAPIDITVGVSWGLLTMEPQDVFIPELMNWMLLHEVRDKMESRLRSGEWNDNYMEHLATADIDDATFIDCNRPPSGAPCAAARFEAFIDYGRSVQHMLVVATPRGRPTWFGIVVEDHTDNSRKFAFSASFIRTKKERKATLLHQVTSMSYTFFLCYLSLRAKRNDRASMYKLHLESLHSLEIRPAFVTYKELAVEHLTSAIQMMPNESLLKTLKNGRRLHKKVHGVAKPTKGVEKRLVTCNTALSNLPIYQKAFCGIVNNEFHTQRTRDATDARAVASKYASASDSDSVFRCLSEVNAALQRELMKRKEHSEQVLQEVTKRARKLQEEGKIKEALEVMTTAAHNFCSRET